MPTVSHNVRIYGHTRSLRPMHFYKYPFTFVTELFGFEDDGITQ